MWFKCKKYEDNYIPYKHAKEITCSIFSYIKFSLKSISYHATNEWSTMQRFQMRVIRYVCGIEFHPLMKIKNSTRVIISWQQYNSTRFQGNFIEFGPMEENNGGDTTPRVNEIEQQWARLAWSTQHIYRRVNRSYKKKKNVIITR